MPTKLTTEDFITKAKKIHGDRYDYSLVKYVSAKANVDIICERFGIQMITEDDLIKPEKPFIHILT